MIKYNFNNNSGILEVTFHGKVDAQEIIDYIIYNTNNKDYPRELRIITDAYNAVFDLNSKDLHLIKKYIYKNVIPYVFIADAFVVNKQTETALSIYYKEITQIPKYFFEVFSTFEAAKNWLMKEKV